MKSKILPFIVLLITGFFNQESVAQLYPYGNPSWSADGKKIVFDSNKEGLYNIYAIDSAGKEPDVKLTRATSNDFDPAWSPDGLNILFVTDRNGKNDLYLMKNDGADVNEITPESTDRESPAWSPDATKIVYVSGAAIWTMNVDRTDKKQVKGASPNAIDPCWASGDQLLFSKKIQGNFEICLLNLKTAEIGILAPNAKIDIQPAITKDGKKVAFVSARDGNNEIYTMDIKGGSIQRLTDNAGDDFNPAWSPDGSKIAFASNRGEKWGIYVMDVKKKNAKRIAGEK